MNDRYLPGSVLSYVDATAVFFSGIGAAMVALTIALAVVGESQLTDLSQLILLGTTQAVAMLGVAAALSRSHGSGSWSVDFGFAFRASDWLGIIYGFGLQIGVVVFVQVPLQLILNLDDPPQQSAIESAGEATGFWAGLALIVVFVILAPLSEEVLYRGIILARARRTMSPRNALLLSSALFAGIHLIDPNAAFAVPALFVVGLVLGYQALRTDRIGLAITTHAGFNLLTTIGLLLNIGG